METIINVEEKVVENKKNTMEKNNWLPRPPGTNPFPYIVYATKDKVDFYKQTFESIPGSLTDHKLSKFISENKVNSITIVCYPLQSFLNRLDRTRMGGQEHAGAVIEFINRFNQIHSDAWLVYVISHMTGGNPRLISVGGDCYRSERPDFRSMLVRTKDLAEGMLKKSSLIFTDIPALTGGKKGEFGIIDSNEKSISFKPNSALTPEEQNREIHLADDAIFEISKLIMPIGIRFLNEVIKPNDAPIAPDSLSPDVFTGARWENYTDYWKGNSVDHRYMTCDNFEAGMNSAIPTAYGVVAAVKALSDGILNKSDFASKHFLMEGFGGVGENAVKFFINEHKVPAANITVIDPDGEKCAKAKTYGINVINSFANPFYDTLNVSESTYDIWVNNGVGDTVGINEVKNLLKTGVKIFAGGANNLFLVEELSDICKLIAEQKASAFPDWACSAGGWTYAVLQQIKKADSNFKSDANQIIAARNVKTVNEALRDYTPGQDLWAIAESQAKSKIEFALSHHATLTDDDFDIKKWKI